MPSRVQPPISQTEFGLLVPFRPLLPLPQRLGDRPRQLLRGIVADVAGRRGNANARPAGGSEDRTGHVLNVESGHGEIRTKIEHLCKAVCLGVPQAVIMLGRYALSRRLTKGARDCEPRGFGLHLAWQLR